MLDLSRLDLDLLKRVGQLGDGDAAVLEAAAAARAAGLLCHAGHGLTYESLGPVAAIPEVVEASIGHFLIGQSVFEGLPAVVRRFRAVIAEARAG